jgi:hypothetical protein
MMMPDTCWGLVDRYSFERLASDPDSRILKKFVYLSTQLPIFNLVNDADQTAIQKESFAGGYFALDFTLSLQ